MPPFSDQPWTGPDDTAAPPLSLGERVAELTTLVSDMETSESGSRSLDTRLHYGVRVFGGLGEDLASVLIKEGVSWPVVQETLDETVPPYSTSLDAALLGEEIVFSVKSARQRRWGAMQRTGDGGEMLAWAATEPLARRLAALKCRLAELEKALKDENDFIASLDGSPPVSPPPEAEPATAEPVIAEEEHAPNPAAREEDLETGGMIPPQEDTASAPHTAPEPPEKEEQEWKILF